MSKTVFIANWHTNTIKERVEKGRNNVQVFIVPQYAGEQDLYLMYSDISRPFDTYDAAIIWIKKKHAERIERVKLDLERAIDKQKHPIKFYRLVEIIPNPSPAQIEQFFTE